MFQPQAERKEEEEEEGENPSTGHEPQPFLEEEFIEEEVGGEGKMREMEGEEKVREMEGEEKVGEMEGEKKVGEMEVEEKRKEVDGGEAVSTTTPQQDMSVVTGTVVDDG